MNEIIVALITAVSGIVVALITGTDAATRKFQLDHGLVSDGIAD